MNFGGTTVGQFNPSPVVPQAPVPSPRTLNPFQQYPLDISPKVNELLLWRLGASLVGSSLVFVALTVIWSIRLFSLPRPSIPSLGSFFAFILFVTSQSAILLLQRRILTGLEMESLPHLS